MGHPVLEQPPDVPLRILSEITDAVILTDSEHHVVYWNGPAEQFYGLTTEEMLGRPLHVACPGGSAAFPSQEVLTQALAAQGRWTGEVVLRPGSSREVWLDCSVVVLKGGTSAELLWIQRDITARKRLETDLRRAQAHIRPLGDSRESEAPDPPLPSKGGTQEVILWAEDDEDDALLMARAWQQARATERLIRVTDGDEVIRYLEGDGPYQDRQRFPAPDLLLLDIRMPHRSGPEVIHWLRTQPCWQDLPVVILTSSTAADDVQESARLRVKGYLVKPLDVAEWVYKVKTITSQCR